MLKLKRVAISNFRSIIKTDFPLSESGLSIFIGRNNCGKTNILKGCELLKYMLVPDEMAQKAQPTCNHVNNHKQIFVFTFEASDNPDEQYLINDLPQEMLNDFPEINIRFEHANNHSPPNDSTIKPFIIYVNDFKFDNLSIKDLHINLFFNKMIHSIYYSPAYRLSTTNELIDLPDRADSSGDNLIPFLFNKFSNYKPDFDKYLKVVQDIVPEIKDIYMKIEKGVAKSDRFNVSLNIVEHGSPMALDYKDLGSGVEQVLILIAQVLFSEKESIHLIDEPGDSLHPTAQRYLLDFFKDQIKNEGKTFLIASHSTSFVNYPNYESLFHVVKDENGTRVNPLSEPEEIHDILLDVDEKQEKRFDETEKKYGLDKLVY